MAIDIPAVACDVTLILPGREMLPGRVDAAGAEALEVAMLAAPGTPVPVLEKATMFLEYVGAEGVCRMTGSLKALGRAPRHTDQEGVYDVVRFTPTGPPQLMQLRADVRTHYVLDMNVMGTECRTVSVSGAGLRIRGLEGATIGDELPFQLEAPLPGELPITGRARVVWVTADGDLGVEFLAIAPDDRDRLVRFAYAHELAARRRDLLRR
jgi:hypothetical protein